jgi:hypothetical protein
MEGQAKSLAFFVTCVRFSARYQSLVSIWSKSVGTPTSIKDYHAISEREDVIAYQLIRNC